MNLRDLQIFIAVCDAGNLTRAARCLRISQPSLSRTIRNLEASLGMPLFRRTGRGVESTEAGWVLRSHAERILREMAELETELGQLRHETAGAITVLVPHYVSRLLVPPLVRQFTARFAHAAIHVFEETASDIPNRLSAGTADLGIFYSSQPGVGLLPEAIASERMYLVGRSDMLGARPDPISFEEAARMPLILSSPQTPFRRLLEERAEAAGRTLSVVRELEVSYTTLVFVRDGEGAAILPLSHCYTELDDGTLVARPIEQPPITRDILLAFGTGRATPLSRQAAELIREIVASEGRPLGWLTADKQP